MRKIFVMLVCTIFVCLSSCYEPIPGSGNVIRYNKTFLTINSIRLESIGNVFVTEGSPQKIEIEVDDNFIENIKTNVINKKLTISTKDMIKPTVLNFYITIADVAELINSGSGTIELENNINQGSTLWLTLNGSGNIILKNLKTLDLRAINDGSGSIYFDLVNSINLVNIELEGSGNIIFKGLSSEKLYVTSSGSGLVQSGEGFITTGDYNQNGSGAIDMKNVTANNVKAINSSSGKILLTSTIKLDATITGSGNIEYWGNPQDIKQNITGSGKLLKRD